MVPQSPIPVRWRTPLLALALIMLAVGAPDTVTAQTEPAEETTSEPTRTRAMADNVPVKPEAQDSQIQARLQRILEASGWFTDPKVEVREGIVFLDGFSGTLEQSDWAGALAARTEDVVAVVNRIEIEPDIDWDLSPALQEIQRISTAAQRAVPVILIGAVILLITWQIARLAARFMGWVLGNRIASPLMLTVVSRAFAVPVFVLGLYLVLQISGLTNLALTVLGGTGVAGIIIGFAFRDIAENFLASLLLSVRNPFRAGDLVRVGEAEGIVTNLNTRSTVLLTQEGNHVQIPNALVFKSVITNFSSNPSRRGDFSVGISYDDRTSEAQEIVEKVLTSHPAVRHDPAPIVVVDELAASTVNLKVFFWFDSDTHSPIKLRSALMRQTKQALLDGGISMPDEAREVIFPQGLPIYRGEPGGKPVAPRRARPPRQVTESDATSAEGGLASEEDDVLREAGATRTPDERENLLKGS